MLYDPERTRSVIQRMVMLGNNLRPVTITISVVNYTLLFGILGALLLGGYWFIPAIIGALVGLAFGLFLAGALSVLIEWMAQLLISLEK